MPRELSSGYVDSLNSKFSDEVDLIFLTARTDKASETIRLVNDAALPRGRPIEYERTINGIAERWIGMPFQIVLFSDDENPPKGSIQFLNADRRVGEYVEKLTDSPDILIEGIKGSDFERLAAPDDYVWKETSTAFVEMAIRHAQLAGAVIDPVWTTCDLMSVDFTREPWPSSRATKRRYPGIYR